VRSRADAVKRALALGLLSRAAALEIAALGDWEPRTCVRDDACANTKAGLYPRNASALILAKRAHLHGVDREAARRVTSTALLSRVRRIGCLPDLG